MQITIETSRPAGTRCVFIVHRDDILRAALRMIIQDSCEAHEIARVQDVLVKGAKKRVNLVLLDAMIVRDEGVAVLKNLAEKLPGARILLVADADNDSFTHSCLSAGADGVLTAPFRLEPVRQAVDRLLDRSALA
jgi:DNA-binding NarL/FixJ family response regulator